MPENNPKSPVIPPYPPDLKSLGRGRRLWRKLHRSADFRSFRDRAAEEACYLADEIERQRKIIRAAGDINRVIGSQKQPVSMPEIADLQRIRESCWDCSSRCDRQPKTVATAS